MKVLALLFSVMFMSAQEKTKEVIDKPGIIEGLVVAEGEGGPIANIEVRTGRIQTNTDAAGRYSLRGVSPGRREVWVGTSFLDRVGGSKTVAVASGQTVNSDFTLPLKGSISGRVTDEYDEPVPGLEVVLIGREYGGGALRYFRRNVARTNDEGEYRMYPVKPGVSYLLLFRKTENRRANAISDVPSEPKLRRPAVIPIYYPGSSEPDGATLLTIHGGEHREEVNVRMPRTRSFCVEGTLMDAGLPASMAFEIYESHLSFGPGPLGGMTGVPDGGKSGSDGQIRICDLHPGEYRLTAYTGDMNNPLSLSTISVNISDRDVRNLSLQPVPRISSIPVEIKWAGEPPQYPAEAPISVCLRSTSRSFGAFYASSPVSVPGKSEVKDLLLDEYYPFVTGLPAGLYLKGIFYGSEEITHTLLSSRIVASGLSLSLLLGHDGGKVKVHLVDRDGNPSPNGRVLVMPTLFASNADLAARSVVGQADQNGDYLSQFLMPGKYLVIAIKDCPVEWTPEFADQLNAVRNRAHEISLAAGTTTEMKIVPLSLR